MFYSSALKSTGAGWSWGANASGQLGTGNVTSYSSPVLIVGSHSFTQISAFNFDAPTNGTSFGLKSNDGSVWAWGWNSYGQLGVNNTTSYSSPILVVGSHSFTRVLTSGNHTAFLKADGSVWCSGKNDFGQLGDNSRTNRSSPVLVVGSHSFIQIAVGLGGSHSLGLKADGAVWAWGTNASGQLGTGNTTSYSSPVLVVGAHSFSKITAGLSVSVGLKVDGSVWCWGSNNFGQLGDNSRTNRSSPVLVVGSHSFNEIISAYNMTRALKASTGAAWSWGENTNGQLGTGNTTSYSSPVIVVGSHSFTQIAAGIYSSLGLKADGAVWSWGYNPNGQLGDNSRTDKSSPVLVVGSHSFISLMNAVNVTVTVVPTITNAGDETFTPIESNVVITGTNFKTTQSTGKVELANNSVYASATIKQSLTVTSWSDTSITVTISLGSLTQGFLWLYVTNSDSNVSNSYKVYVSDGVGKYYGMKFLTDSSQSLATVSNFTPPDRTNGGTVCFWVTSTHLTGAHSLMGCSSIYEIRTDGTVLYNDLNHGTSLGSDIAVDTRFHVACAYGGTLGLNGVANYLNGIKDTSSGAATGNPSPAAFQIGQSQGVYFTGYLEDVRVYNRNLSEAEILTIYSNRGGDGIAHGLVNRWPLCCGPEGVAASGASSIKDLGINSLNMTPTNSPIFNGTDLKQKRRLY